jgi:NADPH2:quinone reductase
LRRQSTKVTASNGATVAAGIIEPSVWKTYALADAAEAHAALEGGASAGAILPKP